MEKSILYLSVDTNIDLVMYFGIKNQRFWNVGFLSYKHSYTILESVSSKSTFLQDTSAVLVILQKRVARTIFQQKNVFCITIF